MTHKASSPRLKIERAKEHIAYLKTAIEDFRGRNPYRAVSNGDVEGGWGTFVVRVEEEIPAMWGVIVGEVFNLCRTSLDNAWFIIAGPSDRQGFPFSENPDGFKSRFKGKEKGAIKKAVDILNRAESCKTGNPLWALANLDNLNKHQAPLLVSSRLRDFVVTSGGRAHAVAFLEPLEEGAILLLPITSEDEVKVEHNVPFEITFSEMEFTKGGAVAPTLENLTGATDGILAALEAAGVIQ